MTALDSKQPHPLDALRRLGDTLAARAAERPSGSYTTKLIEGGIAKMAEKIREESDELIEAAEQLQGAGDGAAAREHFIAEAGDLLYHTMVLLASQNASLTEVAGELGRREGVGGLVEKASRTTAVAGGSNESVQKKS